jgi:NAD+ synthase (glutamine-hydrolysing)
MSQHGFFRVAAASPRMAVGNPDVNAATILSMLRDAEKQGVQLAVFPELCLTGYTCGDLFQDRTLLAAARDRLLHLALASNAFFQGLFVVGLPLAVDEQLFNVAALLGGGRILGLTPKTYLPNEKEFYEQRWFTPWTAGTERTVCLSEGRESLSLGERIWDAVGPVGSMGERPCIGIEVCEDLWTPISQSAVLSLQGANILCNPSASNDLTTKADYRRQLVASQSARLLSGYVYASAGVTESTTDLVFGGHCLIAENGTILAESPRFRRDSEMIVADLDLQRLAVDRLRTRSWNDQKSQQPWRTISHEEIPFEWKSPASPPRRTVVAHPFVPVGDERLRERCEEVFHIQVAGLAKRIESARPTSLPIGVSGGLDSTLALLVAVKTCDLLGMDRRSIHGITMPGFGTSDHTFGNAQAIMQHLGISAETIDIRPLSLDTFRAIGHRPFGIDLDGIDLDTLADKLLDLPTEQRHDLTFENVQARIRTFLLMSKGFVIGTGDMSELALGWATYNGDHMSMYNPNVSIPKTLVRFLVRWAADHEFDSPVREVLHSIAGTEISPELLPPSRDGSIQSTEGSVGPYELHDFFLYHFLRFGSRPAKIFALARLARFDRDYPPAEIKHWLAQFFVRFFRSQYKRSCLPDGPKVGSISLSPRGDWRMPSDADPSIWLAEVESILVP